MRTLLALTLTVLALSHDVAAADRLCDPAFEDCRAPLIDYIRNERVGIDVAFWFMEDARYTSDARREMARGSPGPRPDRLRGERHYPLNAQRLAELQAAGIPMRRSHGSGILHWKMMLFDGQNIVQFSGANYSADCFVPDTRPTRTTSTRSIYFTDDAAVVNSFRTQVRRPLDGRRPATPNYANITRPLSATLSDVFAKDPELNFPPRESYRNRAVSRYNAETRAIDVIMYRITDRAHADAMIRRGQARRARPADHRAASNIRDPITLWHSWNVDRMYMAGVQIKQRAHAGLNHQKSVLLQRSAHDDLRLVELDVAVEQLAGRAQLLHGQAGILQLVHRSVRAQVEQRHRPSRNDAVPAAAARPAGQRRAAARRRGVGTTATLQWNAGIWAHLYDVYFGTEPDPPLIAANLALGPSTNARNDKAYKITGLAPGTAYYWRVVAKTMALQASLGPVSSFATAGAPPPSGEPDIVLYAAHAPTIHGSWSVESDEAAAGGARLIDPDARPCESHAAAGSPD